MDGFPPELTAQDLALLYHFLHINRDMYGTLSRAFNIPEDKEAKVDAFIVRVLARTFGAVKKDVYLHIATSWHLAPTALLASPEFTIVQRSAVGSDAPPSTAAPKACLRPRPVTDDRDQDDDMASLASRSEVGQHDYNNYRPTAAQHVRQWSQDG